MVNKQPIMQQLLDAGILLTSHESDLYVLVTPESKRIVEASGLSYSVFTNQIDGKRWYDIPFAYLPWWERRK